MLLPDDCMLMPQEHGTRVPVDANGNAIGQLRAEMHRQALAFGPKAGCTCRSLDGLCGLAATMIPGFKWHAQIRQQLTDMYGTLTTSADTMCVQAATAYKTHTCRLPHTLQARHFFSILVRALLWLCHPPILIMARLGDLAISNMPACAAFLRSTAAEMIRRRSSWLASSRMASLRLTSFAPNRHTCTRHSMLAEGPRQPRSTSVAQAALTVLQEASHTRLHASLNPPQRLCKKCVCRKPSCRIWRMGEQLEEM